MNKSFLVTLHFDRKWDSENWIEYLQDVLSEGIGWALEPAKITIKQVEEAVDVRDIIVMASDHNGVDLKNQVYATLQREGFHVIDLGPYLTSPSVDYADYAKQLSKIVSRGQAKRGILICGTGMGMSITANKTVGIRAALVHSLDVAAKSREHNDSNVLCLGAWVNNNVTNLEIAKIWLKEEFGQYRHVKRVEKIEPDPNHKIVFANGCFDVLHAGHIELFKFAKSLGDHLVVAINSDRCVKLLKGSDRPIHTQEDRKGLLESLKYVDEVIVFDDMDPVTLIQELNPHIVVRGGEHTEADIRKRDHIPDHIQVKICPIVRDVHTTTIIRHIKES